MSVKLYDKYEHNYNNNKVKNYTVGNVIAYNNKTIRDMNWY